MFSNLSFEWRNGFQFNCSYSKKTKKKISYFSLKHFSKDYNENHLINENKKYLNLKHQYVNIPKRKNLEEFKKIMAFLQCNAHYNLTCFCYRM